MSADREQNVQRPPVPAPHSLAEIIDSLLQFQGSRQEFLARLMNLQANLAGAAGGVILRVLGEARPDVIGVHPPMAAGDKPPSWLEQAVQLVTAANAMPGTRVAALHDKAAMYGQPAEKHLVAIRIGSPAGGIVAAVYLVETRDVRMLAMSKDRLELTASLLTVYEMRQSFASHESDLLRLRAATETLSGVNRQDRFAGAAMAFCNEVAARWQCDRVSLGFLRRRYVRVRAMSHTENFHKKTQLVQDIEAAMEECLDQDLEVAFPGTAEQPVVSRSAEQFVHKHGPLRLLCMPFRKDGHATAVVTLERSPDRPFTLPEVEALRLACDLCTPRLMGLYEHDRWFGERMVNRVRKGLSEVVGPKHTWVKIAVLAAAISLGVIFLAKGDYEAEAPFVLEAIHRQVIPAPFDGFLASAPLEPGYSVDANVTVLATLDSDMLYTQLAGAAAEEAGYRKQADTARRDSKPADEQIAMAQADRAAAKARLLREQIQKSTITSPISGIVLTGELNRRIGKPVKTGDVLFEVAPLAALRADVLVSEDQITDVRVGLTGELATASNPDQRFAFVVERISPVAEVVKQQNVFKVQVRLTEVKDWMRPGMEGVAKVKIDRRSYAWLWTRRLVNWVRMKLWI